VNAPMNHCMTVSAYRDEVPNWVKLILSLTSSYRHGNAMVYENESRAERAICGFEVKATDVAPAEMLCDASVLRSVSHAQSD